MSLRPEPIAPIPEETARIARAAFPKGNLYLRLRDELGVWYRDEDFIDLYAVCGQPAEPPWRLALVLVFQFVEGLSDRQAAEAVRARIDWKYALSLPLTDAGFDASVLSEFRDRLVAHEAGERLLDHLVARLVAEGLIRPRGRARTDSTHVLAAIRILNRLETVGETLRHALNVLATVAPDWLRSRLAPDWLRRYGPRVDEYRFPKGAEARQALANQIGADGVRLYRTLTAADAPCWLAEVPAVETLRQVWLQQFDAPTADRTVRFRAAADLPPAARLIHSPYDVEARYSCKGPTTTWTGYKAALTETCDADRPHLIIHVTSTEATVPDCHLTTPIHEALATKAVLPNEHFLDAGFIDAGVLVAAQDPHQVEVVGPVPVDNHWQARAGKGFAATDFTFDWAARQATCPQGCTSVKWSETHSADGNAIVNIRFARAACAACAVRADCTTSRTGPRELSIRPQAQHLALVAGRQYQTTDEFKARYRTRAGVEGTIGQALRVTDLRHARYIGLPKVHLQHLLTAVALDVCRLGAWFAGRPRATTRTTPFQALARAG